MGLIKAVLGSGLGTLYDEWLEYIYCDSMSTDVLMTKGQARVSGYSGNTNRDSNIISDGSKIAVNEGQCMLVVENGKIIDFSSEPGGYIYNTGTEPSMFDNSEYGLQDAFRKMAVRFQSGGQAMNDQRVYFVNKKEILDNKVGMGNIPFRDAEFNMTLMLKAYGTYTFRIKNPITFYTNIAGNVADTYRKESIEQQMKTEMQSAMLPAISGLARLGLRYDEIPLRTAELATALNDALKDKWLEQRGIELTSIVITNIVPTDSSVEQIRQMQESSAYANNTRMLGARLGASQADAMGAAAANANGAMAGFAGMNMAMGMSGTIDATALLNTPNQAGAVLQSSAPVANSDSWVCSCGQTNTMLYCQECGKKRPEPKAKWICVCGQENSNKFCGACGRKKPKKLVCDKCGYEIDMMAKLPKFCPQCGDPIDENDEVEE